MNTIEHRQNRTTLATRLASPAIWGDCPWEDILDPRSGIDGFARHWNFCDFRTSSNVNAAEAYWADGLKCFGSDGFAITAADAVGGGVTFGSDGDNEGGSFGQMTYPVQISRTSKALWFEARIKASTITDTKNGFFVGLIDSSALSATVPIAANGTLADENLVGFHRLEGDGDALDTVYKADGVTQVTVQADAVTLVADTYVNIGFKYMPQGPLGAYYLQFFSNNLALSTAKQIPSADGTDFPNDVRLGLVIASLNATASTPGTNTIMSARLAQLY